MKSQFAVAMAAIACVGLASCGESQPKGQVVAKVGKDEVTVLDLQAALAGFKAPDAKTRKAAEQQALTAIVQRKILAQAAHKQKIDKTPEYARLQEQTNETAARPDLAGAGRQGGPGAERRRRPGVRGQAPGPL
jgi:hypothetical protein